MITFKQIQLVGFKSFADKTTVTLGEGVTCIVGPNGCGKSNVADAIRWVLGEQSAKMMRGSQMLDVIFSGTEARRKMSMCEVTLTFDNTKRIFDIDCDEVEMTRRLYRDGESEYLLNKQPSRMKILTGLLHGAGAAKEGYSIIGQGRIEQIMNAKPEDRRSIFEEATGIVVFKDRKADAERKLNGARDNLFIHAQRMQEVERQLNPLKKAAENAIKYREIYSELRRHETNLYIVRHDGAEGEKNKISDKKQKIDDRVAFLSNRMDELLQEYQNCRKELDEADVTLQELNDRIRRYEVGIEHKSGESRLYTERAKSVKAKLASAQEDIAFSTKRIKELELEVRRTESLKGKNAERITGMTALAEKLQTETDDLSKKISDYEYQTGEHRKKVMDTFKDLSEMRRNMGSLEAQKELLAERLSEIEAEMNKIRERRDKARDGYEKSIERGNGLAAFLGNEDAMLTEAEQKLKDSEEKIQLLVKQVYDTEAQIRSLNDSLTTVRALRDRFDGYVYSVKRLMSDAKDNPALSSKIKGLIADVVSCERDYEVAIETAFGGAMQNVITGTRDDARELIEYLKANRAGQVTFLPLDALKPRYENDMIKAAVRDKGAVGFAINLVKYGKQFESVIHNLLGNTLIVDNIQNATQIARRYPRAFKIVTLDGDLIATSGSMTGGSRKEVAGNLLANERRIKELEEAVVTKKEFLLRAEGRRAEYGKTRDEASTQLNLLRGKLQNARLELASVTEKQSSLMNEVTAAESEYSAYNQSLSALKQRLTGLDNEYSGVFEGANSLTKQSDKASTAMDDMSAEYDKLREERAEKQEKLNGLRVEIAALNSAVVSADENVARFEREKEEHFKKIERINSGIPAIQREIEMLNAQAEKTALTEEEQKVVNDLRRRIGEVTQSKNELNERIKRTDVERLDSITEREDLVTKSHNLDMALTKIDSDLEFLRQRIDEEYGLTYEGCLEYKEDDYDASTANSQIANCKRQLTMLGAINHNAVEEYDELSAHYEKMVSDRDDMEKAISDLTTALDDIRAEMLKIFDDGFNTINENFKHTFKELFGGGKAELQLDYTDCDDPLNAGVEIIACPPGKKLSKISLLSGGERALTAIAILFAIISMRPMPFCVLDEIEAALDEANVARYAKYLKKFASDTQFIVITHRKPTMESADILFGVTMEEKGVSKVVSVKLSEVAEKLGGDTIM
ncbi:MAG: chromosome segregation protein SMC [Clostridia bacterium]|jgi:chromosome segregation protein|nr:chromosome segregation protein SMC [Clostridia bacterium]